MSITDPSQTKHNTTYGVTVKCSTCGADLDFVAFANHNCSDDWGNGNTFESASTVPDNHITYAEPTSYDHTIPTHDQQSHNLQQRGPLLEQRGRPTLPRIDSGVTARNGLNPQSAASIAHGLGLPSPISAMSGRKSPAKTSARKTPSLSRRSPSPELPRSQDCAFPPFPNMKPKRAQTDRDLAVHASRGPSRSKTHDLSISHSSTSSVQSVGSHGLAKRRPSERSSRNVRSRQDTMDGIASPPSTAPTSPGGYIDENEMSKEAVAGRSSPLPPLEPSLSANTSSFTSPATPNWPTFGQNSPPRNTDFEHADRFAHPDESKPQATFEGAITPNQNNEKGSNPTITFDALAPGPANRTSYNMMINDSKEPSYKAKRPPPLENAAPFTTGDQPLAVSTRVPAPLPTGGLTRTLTNLFSRKRGQSVSAKKAGMPDRDSPRIRALAPEPPAVPARGNGNFGVPDSPGDSYFPPNASGDDVSRNTDSTETSHDVSNPEDDQQRSHQRNMPHQQPQSAQERLKHHEFDTDSHKHDDVDVVRSQSSLEQNPISHGQDDKEESVKELVDEAFTNAAPPKSDASVPDLHRASIDSASSYGSVGFSSRTVSTQSSHHHMPSLDARSKIATALDPDRSSVGIVDLPLPMRPHADEHFPESPTDSSYRMGRLSPVYESPTSPQQGPKGDSSLLDGPGMQIPSITESAASAISTQEVRTTASRRKPSAPGGVKGRCRGCAQLIMIGQKSVSSKDGRLTGKYHKECFGCRTCKEAFATAEFYVYNDQPYCAQHYHEHNGTLCAGCGKGVEGQYFATVNSTGEEAKKFHPECLTCWTCHVQLNEDYFEFQGRVYCEQDAFKATQNPRSPYGNAPTRPSPLNREYINSGEPGLKGRFPERRTTRLMMM